MPRVDGTEIRPGVFAPLVRVRLEAGGRMGEGPALVDSGADVTIFPGEIIESMGYPFDTLKPAGSGVGAGGTFKVCVMHVTATYDGTVFATQIQVAAPGKLTQALVGRSDFFRVFVVRFQWHRSPPTFDVDPSAGAASRRR